MSNFYVYVHYTLDTNELFYIGKGSGKRAWKKHSRNSYWKNIANKHGYRIEIIIDNLIEESAFIQEILAIKELKPRANITGGGMGSSGHIPWNKGLKGFLLGNKNPMYGKSIYDFMSDEKIKSNKLNHSIKTKARWDSMCSEEKKKISERCSERFLGDKNPMYGKIPWNKGKLHSEETKNKISQKAKNRTSIKKLIKWNDTGKIMSAVEIANILKSHRQSIREAARKNIKHKKQSFTYV